MALGYLTIFYIAITLISILGILFLYLSKNQKTKDKIFYALVIWSVLVTFFNVTALPSNFLIQRILAIVIGLIAMIGFILKIKTPKNTHISYFLVSLSVILSIIDIFFF